MPLTKKEKNRRYQQSHKPQLARKMRIYRAKKKLEKETEDAWMEYEKAVLPFTIENWHIREEIKRLNKIGHRITY